MYSKIIIDVPNLFFRNYSVFKEQRVIDNNQELCSGAIQGFLKSFNKIQREYGIDSTEYYMLYDNMASKDLLRKNLNPDYKITRQKYEESYYKSLDFLAFLLMNYSDKVYNVQCPSYEADDLPPALIFNFNKYDRVLVISEDLDYSRCIAENIHWLQHNEVVTKEKFNKKFGFFPTKENVILWKTLIGDHSDNIKKVIKGLHNKDIIYLISKYKDIYDLLENINKEVGIIGEKFVNLIKENKSELIVNYQLIDFIEIGYEYLKDYIYKGQFNSKVLRYLYKTLDLKISEVDKRLLNSFPEKDSLGNKSFFDYQKIQRR